MTIEPQKVEPGFAKRWSIQAIALMLRSPVVWGIVMLVYFLTSKIIEHSIWYIFLGSFLLMVSLEFAAFTDFNKMSVDSFFSCIKMTAKHYVQFLKDRKIFILLFSTFIIILDKIIASSITRSPEPSSMFSSVIYCLLFGYILLNNGGQLQIFAYPLRRAFDSDETKAIAATCMKAIDKNPGVLLFFEMGIFMSMVIIGSLIPIVGLFYVGFLPCIIYVAFREIFWGKRENQKQEETSKKTSTKMVLIPVKD